MPLISYNLFYHLIILLSTFIFWIDMQMFFVFLDFFDFFCKNILTFRKTCSIILFVTREWRNRQTRTFEGRVFPTYGFKSRLPHQTGIIRTLSNQGSYFSLLGITSVFKSLAEKRIARSFYTRSYGLFSFIGLYSKPDFFAFRGG